MRTSRFSGSSWHALGALGVLALGGFLSGCGSEPAPVTSQTSKYEVADDAGGAGGSAPAAGNTSASSPSPDAAASAPPQALTGGNAPSSAPATGNAASATTTPGTATPNDIPEKPSAIPPPPTVTSAPGAGADVAQLLAHIQALQNQDPRAATREETITNLSRNQREVIITADRILKGAGTDDVSLSKAADAKIGALNVLAQINPESAGELKGMIQELKASGKAPLIRKAEQLEFGEQMDALARGEQVDLVKLMTRFKKLFSEEKKEVPLFTMSQQVIQVLMQAQHQDEAVDVMRMVATNYASSTNTELANAAKMVAEQIAIVELKLDSKISAVLEGKPKASEELLAGLDQLLANPQLGAMTLQYLTQVTQIAEQRDMALAEGIFTKMTAAYGKSANPDLLKGVQQMAENFGKRKAILGQPFVVEGLTLEGQPFNWSQFQGKVVLVDFWATWCGPCLREIPNIKENYEKYKAQGFEVVGVNIDEEPENLQRFFARQKLPWPTVLSPDPKKVGFEHPLMVKCGVEGIPFLVLVGRDGKAIALNPRGEELGKKLAAIFSGVPAAPSGANPLRGAPAPKADAKSGGS